jgi:acyl dehydratase
VENDHATHPSGDRSGWRRQAAAGLSVGDTFEFSRTFSTEDVARFGELTRDQNPIHSDAAFAGLKGFSGPVCHGLLVGALFTEIGGQLAWLATRLDFSFLRPAYPGELLTCTLRIESINEKRFAVATGTVADPSGQTLVEVRLEGFVPGPGERARLKSLFDREKRSCQ